MATVSVKRWTAAFCGSLYSRRSLGG